MAHTPPRGGVETGGADAGRRSFDAYAGVLGAALVLGSGAYLWSRRQTRAQRG